MRRLLATETMQPLFVSGCAPNMRAFPPPFDEIVLLSAPAPLIEARLGARSDAAYGTRRAEVAATLANLEAVEPLLVLVTTCEIDTQSLWATSSIASCVWLPLPRET